MRHSPLRVATALLLALTCTPFLAGSAWAEDGPERRKPAPSKKQRIEILKGLQAGLRALRALGGQEETIEHLSELAVRLKRNPKRGERKPKGDGNSEEQNIGRMVRTMLMAHRVLRAADHEEHADVMERGAHSLRMLASGRTDEEAMHALATAPSRERQAKSLLLAAKLLRERGQDERAQQATALGRKFQDRKSRKKTRTAKSKRKPQQEKPRKARRRTERPAPKRPDTKRPNIEELEGRLKVLRMAMPALREGNRRGAAEMLERAIHTGELMLAGRRDEEAQKTFRHTPSLVELAEILHLAARLWLEFKQPEEAEAVALLSRHYRVRAAGKQGERESAEPEGARRGADVRGKSEAERERQRSWAVRQQAEVEERRSRDERARVQREHENRMRRAAPARRGPGAERKRGKDDAGERIDKLRRELEEVQRALQALMHELREIARER